MADKQPESKATPNPMNYTESYHRGLVEGTKAGFWGGVAGAVAGAAGGWFGLKKLLGVVANIVARNGSEAAENIREVEQLLAAPEAKYAKAGAAVVGALVFASVASVVAGYVGRVVGTSKGADPVAQDTSWVQSVGQTNSRIDQLAQQQQQMADWMSRIQSEHDAKKAAEVGGRR